MASWLSVKVLANAFNISEASLMGRVYTTKSFDIYSDDGVRVFDGSKIIAQICDKRWFKIRDIDMFMDEFYNANNRSWQKFLNYRGSYNFSYFANCVQLVSELPTLPITSMEFIETSPSVEEGKKILLHINSTPFQGTTTVTFTSGTVAKATVTKVDDRTVEVTGVDDGTSVITATAGEVTATVTVTVTAASA